MTKKFLDLDFKCKTLKGEDIQVLGYKNIEYKNIAQYVADVIVARPSNQSMKIYSLAQELFNFGKLELDMADFQLLKNQILEVKMNTILEAQILRAFNEAKDVEVDNKDK
ncbi:MAG: hypothetical protein BV456_01070 [Thermoplasmata archaeon M8B2D]|nr:MAG: hypothetical protein BV456_01070 [Thermoplasmata archaeon M8B2D]